MQRAPALLAGVYSDVEIVAGPVAAWSGNGRAVIVVAAAVAGTTSFTVGWGTSNSEPAPTTQWLRSTLGAAATVGVTRTWICLEEDLEASFPLPFVSRSRQFIRSIIFQLQIFPG